MGGRGASAGGKYIYNGKEHEYGDEYTTVLEYKNIKFITYNDSTAAKSPAETRTTGRIYVTIDGSNEPKYISLYDQHGMLKEQIDLKGKAHWNDGIKYDPPHIHLGLNHKESGFRGIPTKGEQKLIDMVRDLWNNKDKQEK